MTLDYFYGQTGELFSFYRIPKALFQEQRFQSLSTDAKTLYGILLDRMSLSAKNGWLDKQDRVFILFTIEDVKRTLCCADNKATKLLRELEKFGLIERKRRGQGKPSLVYADDPEAGWQTADEYLSGNVRDKLRMAQLAAENHPEFKVNEEALTKAQPKDLEASEIDVRLGATWLDPSIVQQFMMETFQPPYRIRYNNAITVRYSPYTSEWRISNKSATGFGDIMATETYGTRRANAYKILEDIVWRISCSKLSRWRSRNRKPALLLYNRIHRLQQHTRRTKKTSAA